MSYKPLIVGVLLSVIIVLTSLIVSYGEDRYKPKDLSNIAVRANEISVCIASEDYADAATKAELLKTEAQQAVKADTDKGSGIWVVCAVSVIMINACMLFIWFSVIKPFRNLEKFADKIANGDFDISLKHERNNYFGKFTWAFDNMRREIVKARSCEKEAIDNNKTVIATLSHDLKTPLASINAYSEALLNGLYSDNDEMYSYIEVISRKCDELSRLTNDMMTHSISELGALKMQPESIDLNDLISETLKSTSADGKINYEVPMFPVRVYADKNRLVQLIGNIIGNAQKYTDGRIDISVNKKNRDFEIIFRDHGQGIPDEDIPFIFDKFYRGSNSKEINGSGLGLYIVRYIARRSGGDVLARNSDEGLEIIVTLPEERIQTLKPS